MGKQGLFVIIALITFFAIHQSGEAVKCYVCDSRTNSTCKDDSVKFDTVECATCGKCSGELMNGTEVIVRNCNNSPDIYTDLKSKKCDYCKSELCNNGNAISVTMISYGCFALLWAIGFVFTNPMLPMLKQL